MRKKVLKLPLYLLGTGVLLNAITFFSVSRIIKGTNEWTLEMGRLLNYIDGATALLCFVLIGLLLRKSYDRKTCFWASTLMVGYSLVSLAIEQLSQHFGTYNMVSFYMYVPIQLFINLSATMVRLISIESIWPGVIFSILAPYLFLLFIKKDAVSDLEPVQ